MLNKYIILIFLTLSVSFVKSQAESANWFFGIHAGASFNANTESYSSFLSGGQTDTREGCAAISNLEGSLMFYTDGTTVWNSAHNVMPNGTELLGNFSSTQSAIIVPFVNNPGMYYVFTVDAQTSAGGNQTGINYSVVDMSLDSGNGDVVASQKNINLLFDSSEKICATKKSDDTGYWILTFGYASETSEHLSTIYAYEVTAAGINTTPVVSSTNLETDERRGYLKISPNGSKIAMANMGDNTVSLFDFDDTTGIASNQTDLGIYPDDDKPYGLEFSPNSDLLYVHASNDAPSDDDTPSTHSSVLLQFDLNASDIESSQTVIDEQNMYRGALQLALDGKIYRTTPVSYNIGSNFLSVINNPNNLGLACNYTPNAHSLGGGTATQGLPPFISSFFDTSINVANVCYGSATEFSLTSDDTITSVVWDFGDPNASSNSSVSMTPTHTFTASGTYTVSATVVINGVSEIYTEAVTIYAVPQQSTVSDWLQCTLNNDGTYTFDLTEKNSEVLDGASASQFDVSYYHSEAEAISGTDPITAAYTTAGPETIFVKVENQDNTDCSYITSFVIETSQQPVVNGMTDIYTCDENGLYIDVDLTDKIAEAYGIQSQSDFALSFHTSQDDANNNVDPIDIVYNTLALNQTIYARLENIDHPECYDLGDFEIQVYPTPDPVTPDDLISCMLNNSEEAEFDTSGITETILDGHPEYSIMYYDQDGNQIGEELPNPYQSPSQTLTAVVSDSYPVCYSFDEDNFTLNGDATQEANDVIQLTEYEAVPDSDGNGGSAWANIMLDLSEDFTISAEMFFGNYNAGADGIAFVIQPLTVNAGTIGGGIGYQGISPSLAVEFDTYHNGTDPINNDHVAIIKNGLAASNAAHSEFTAPYDAGNIEDGHY